MKNFFLLALSLFSIACFGQTFNENFDDGSFSDGPVWGGNTAVYIINAAEQLQLMDDVSGTTSTYLSTPVSTAGETTWEFYFLMDFAPSTSNQLKVYLNSDAPDLTGSLNGYFIQVGATGSDDALEFHRQDGSNSTLLLSGSAGSVGSDPATARVRVLRDNAGNWELLADYSGGTNFTSEGTVSDNTYTAGEHFGFNCKYTSTRDTLFYFDDIVIDPIFVDMTPPEIVEVIAISNTELDVRFSEAVTAASANIAARYSLDGFGNPTMASLDGMDPTLVHLSGFSPLTNGQQYTLEIMDVEDVNSNPANDSYTFQFIVADTAEQFDVLINEFMADPSPPPIGVPAVDYIELFNFSSKFIDLASLELSDDSGASFDALPSFILTPGSYVILADDDDLGLFAGTGDALPYPSLSLNATTDDGIVLRRIIDGLEIHSKLYTSSEIEDSKSLEFVNPNLTCAGAENWIVSTDSNGGTPNAENSEFNDTPDTAAPQLVEAEALSATELLLTFDEIININSLSFTGVNGITNPQLQADEMSVIVNVDALMNGVTYTVNAIGATDCYGNGGNNGSADFVFFLVQIAQPYDILINEFIAVLTPDPLGLPDEEYIELYNRSDKVIELSSLELSLDEGDSYDVLPSYIMQPGEYIILTEDALLYDPAITAFNFPMGLSDGSDGIVLRRVDSFLPIHSKFYGAEDFIEGGKSLELVNPNLFCSGASNWIVSENPDGGTPGFENSTLETTADNTLPDLLCANFIGGGTIQLVFNKALEPASASNAANYAVDGVGNPDFIVLEAPNYNTLLLTFNAGFTPDQIYTITIDNVNDCSGNLSIGMMNTADFANSVLDGDEIIINEILFAPDTDGFDFVEIYNNSDKILSLDSLLILEYNDGELVGEGMIETQCPLLPGQYLALTENPEVILENYPDAPDPSAIVVMELPNFLVDEGGVGIAEPVLLGEPIPFEKFDYSENFHNPLLEDTKGFSLERIDFDAPTQDENNWESAAAAVRATPGYVNSQNNPLITEDGSIFIEDEVFSPDNDGFEDFLQISYDLDQTGYTANVRIYDAKGRQVKGLANNELLSPRGFFKWNGELDNGEKARVGIYIVWVELFDANGKVSYFKKPCVVAGNFGG